MSYRNLIIGNIFGSLATTCYFQRDFIKSWFSTKNPPNPPTSKKFLKKSYPQTILVGVDIEKAGSLYSHPVLSVGFAVGDLDGHLLETKKFNIQAKWFKKNETGQVIDYGDFEPRCVEEFWSKLDKKIIDTCLSPVPEPPETSWLKISEWLDKIEILYPSPDYKIKFVTDNASFDIANIDYNLEKYLGRRPMRYSKTGNYRSIISADDMLDMIPPEKLKIIQTRINNCVVHDHDCVNDASNIMLQGMEALNYKNSLV